MHLLQTTSALASGVSGPISWSELGAGLGVLGLLAALCTPLFDRRARRANAGPVRHLHQRIDERTEHHERLDARVGTLERSFAALPGSIDALTDEMRQSRKETTRLIAEVGELRGVQRALLERGEHRRDA